MKSMYAYPTPAPSPWVLTYLCRENPQRAPVFTLCPPPSLHYLSLLTASGKLLQPPANSTRPCSRGTSGPKSGPHCSMYSGMQFIQFILTCYNQEEGYGSLLS